MQDAHVYALRFPEWTAARQIQDSLRAIPSGNGTFSDPAFGYHLAWNPQEWQLTGGLFDDNRYLFTLADGMSWVSWTTLLTGDAPPTACIERANDEAGRFDGVTTAIIAPNEGGAPTTGEAPGTVWSAVDITQADGQQYRVFHQCWQLPGGEASLLLRQTTMASADMAEVAAKRDRLLAGLTLPAAADDASAEPAA
jgi:hypothetical protein